MTQETNHEFRNGIQIIKGLLKQVEKQLKAMEKAYNEKPDRATDKD